MPIIKNNKENTPSTVTVQLTPNQFNSIINGIKRNTQDIPTADDVSELGEEVISSISTAVRNIALNDANLDRANQRRLRAQHTEVKTWQSTMKDLVVKGARLLYNAITSGIEQNIRSLESLSRSLQTNNRSFNAVQKTLSDAEGARRLAQDRFNIDISTEQLTRILDHFDDASLNFERFSKEAQSTFVALGRTGITLDPKTALEINKMSAEEQTKIVQSTLRASANDLRVNVSRDLISDIFNSSEFAEARRAGVASGRYATQADYIADMAGKAKQVAAMGGSAESQRAIVKMLSLTGMSIMDAREYSKDEESQALYNLLLSRLGDRGSEYRFTDKDILEAFNSFTDRELRPLEAINKDLRESLLAMSGTENDEEIPKDYTVSFENSKLDQIESYLAGWTASIITPLQKWLPENTVSSLVGGIFSKLGDFAATYIAVHSIRRDTSSILTRLGGVGSLGSRSNAPALTAGTSASAAGTAAATAGKGARFAKMASTVGKGALKALPVVGAVAGVGAVGYEVYSAFNESIPTIDDKDMSTNFRRMEDIVNRDTRTAKVVGASVSGALSLGAAAAGMKIGATLGSAAPGIGTVIGGVVGGAVGLAVSPLIDSVVEDIAANNEVVKSTASLVEISGKLSELENEYQNLTEEERKYFKPLIDEERKKKDLALSQSVDSLMEYEKTRDDELKNDDAQGVLQQIADRIASSSDLLTESRANIEKYKAESELDPSKRAANIRRIAEEESRVQLLVEEISRLNEAFIKVGKTTYESLGQYDDVNEALSSVSDGISSDKMAEEVVSMYTSRISENFKDKLEEGVLEDDLLRALISRSVSSIVTQSQQEEIFGNVKAIRDARRSQLLKEARSRAEMDSGVDTSDMLMLANGGIVDGPTGAIVGEDGPEAILPLSKPERFQAVLSQAVNTPGAAEEVADSFTYADRAISFLESLEPPTDGKSKNLKHPYMLHSQNRNGYVCNEIVQAAYRAAGFQFPSGSVSGLLKMKNPDGSPVMHIVTDPSSFRRGMLGFGTHISKDTGLPTHIGILDGSGGMYHSSGSNAPGYTYSSNPFVATPNSRGVVHDSRYDILYAGYLDGMLSAAELEGITPGRVDSSMFPSSDYPLTTSTYSFNNSFLPKKLRYNRKLSYIKSSLADALNRFRLEELYGKDSSDLISNNNIYGLEDSYGLRSFDTMEDGVDAKLELLDKRFLSDLGMVGQVTELAKRDLITKKERNSVLRLVSSLGRLRESVDRNTRVNEKPIPSVRMPSKRSFG